MLPGVRPVQSRVTGIIFLALLASAPAVANDIVQLPYETLELNGRLVKTSDWPRGNTILMTHGTLSHRDSEIMRSLQDLFAEEGISSLAINLSLDVDKREGAYDCAVPHRHQHADAVAEIRHWVDWLVAEGAENIALLGHSRGANQTAMLAATQLPEQVFAQILLAPPAQMAAANCVGGTVNCEALGGAQDAVGHGAVESLIALPRFLYCDDARVSAESLLSYYGDGAVLDTPELLRQSSLPGLVLVGSEDEATPGLASHYAPLSVYSRLQFVEIDGAGHFFRDLYGEEAVEAIIEFLGSAQELDESVPVPVVSGDAWVYATNGSFQEVKTDLVDAIESRGIVISYVAHAASMLQRTAQAVDALGKAYDSADILLFCKADLTYQLTRTNPHNLALCPYSISVYTLHNDWERVYLSIRAPVPEVPEYQPVHQLLEEIIAETLSW